MIDKNSLNCRYLRKKDFYSHPNIEDITDVDYMDDCCQGHRSPLQMVLAGLKIYLRLIKIL